MRKIARILVCILVSSPAYAQELEFTPHGPRFEWGDRHDEWRHHRDWDRENYWRWRHRHHWHHHYYDEDDE
jgi:hypothetical protein